MVKRQFWIDRIEKAWEKRSIIWLSGVRQSGKTTLCKSLNNIEYFDCDQHEVRERLASPTSFLTAHKGKRIVLDEIHRLSNPSEILKNAADHFPETKIIATGSSTLSAFKKFTDTLTGRKVEIHLTPLLLEEGPLLGNSDIDHRLLFGGLPAFFLEDELPEDAFQEWLSSYWAKDIQELFRLEKRWSFLKFTELLLSHSGSMFEATRYTESCEASRPTISNYLSVMETMHLMRVIRPYTGNSASEIKSAPRVYGFDTGFICHMRAWKTLRPADYGPLWEHIVLNELIGHIPYLNIHYWRNKQGHEIDFVLLRARNLNPIAIECKWSYRSFDPVNIKVFRHLHPDGKNYVVVSDLEGSFDKHYDGLEVTFLSLQELLLAVTT